MGTHGIGAQGTSPAERGALGQRRTLTRRSVMVGAAWAVPAIAVAAATPAFAASNCLGMNDPNQWTGVGVGSLNSQTAGQIGNYYSFWKDAQNNNNNLGYRTSSSDDAWYALSNNLTATAGSYYTLTVEIATQGGYDGTGDSRNNRDWAKDGCYTGNTDMLLFVRNANDNNVTRNGSTGVSLIGAFQTQPVPQSNQQGITLLGQTIPNSSTTYQTVGFPLEPASGQCAGTYGFGVTGQPPLTESSPGLPWRYVFTCVFQAPSASIQLGMKFIPFGADGANDDDYHVWITVNECSPTGTPGITPVGTEAGSTTPVATQDCAAEWSSSTQYSQGDTVLYGTHNWQAKKWGSGHTPGPNSSYWTDLGSCDQPACAAQWVAPICTSSWHGSCTNWSGTYSKNATVLYGGHNWQSTSSNNSDTPGTSGADWTDLGPCTSNAAMCAAKWSATATYTVGSQVSYQGHNFTWTQGGKNQPNYWLDNGACTSSTGSPLRRSESAFLNDAEVTTTPAPSTPETTAPTADPTPSSSAPSTDTSTTSSTPTSDTTSSSTETTSTTETTTTDAQPGDPGYVNAWGGNTPPPVITDPTAVDVDPAADAGATATGGSN